MTKEFVLECIKNIVWNYKQSHYTAEETRRLLNVFEKDYPQLVFIKTNLCKRCDKLHIEVWVKEYTID